MRRFLADALPHVILALFSAMILLPLLWVLRVSLTDKLTAYKIPPEIGTIGLMNYVEIFTAKPFTAGSPTACIVAARRDRRSRCRSPRCMAYAVRALHAPAARRCSARRPCEPDAAADHAGAAAVRHVPAWLPVEEPRRNCHRAYRYKPAVPGLDAGRPSSRARSARWRRRRGSMARTRWQAFRVIAVPVAAPGILAAGLLGFILSWNEFLFALVLSGSPTPDAAGRAREPRDACRRRDRAARPPPRLWLSAGVRAAAVPAPIPDQGAVARSAQVKP